MTNKTTFKWGKQAEWRRKFYHDKSLKIKIEIKKKAFLLHGLKKEYVHQEQPIYERVRK